MKKYHNFFYQPNGIISCSFAAQNQLISCSRLFTKKCCQNVVKMLSKRCHFLSRSEMLSKCCQNVVKMLSFLKFSFQSHFQLIFCSRLFTKKCCQNVVKMLSKRCHFLSRSKMLSKRCQNVVKTLSFFMDPKRLHLCSIKAPFRLHFASPVPLGWALNF